MSCLRDAEEGTMRGEERRTREESEEREVEVDQARVPFNSHSPMRIRILTSE